MYSILAIIFTAQPIFGKETSPFRSKRPLNQSFWCAQTKTVLRVVVLKCPLRFIPSIIL
jgi:hypothetical protein